MNKTENNLQAFIFEDTDIRGKIVSLSEPLEKIQISQKYPAAIKQLLGEFLAAAALLSSTLKFEGILTLQARGDGDLPLIMAEVDHHKKVRAVAHCDNENNFNQRSLKSLLGKSILSIIIDPDKGERYQGIVPLEKEHLAECLEDYFLQSEQLPTRLWLATNDKQASGLLLQRLPQQIASEEDNQDAWETQVHLANTLTSEELLTLDHSQTLTRLFHESSIRVFDAEAIRFGCSCSRERSAASLKQFPQEELESILQEEGKITVDCHFCGHQYLFNSDDINQLFSPETLH